MELQRIIVHDYPVKFLPDDLKADFDMEANVTVTVETEGEWLRGSTAIEVIKEFRDGMVVKLSERTFIVQ